MEETMTTIQSLEILAILLGIFGTFFTILNFLLKFQRKIDRLLMLATYNKDRLEDVEIFLEKEAGFEVKRLSIFDTIPH
jgi:hypothetical protein